MSERRDATLRGGLGLAISTVAALASLASVSALAASGRELGGALERALRSVVQERTYHYEMEQVWPTTVRYLRVDRGFEITEQDSASGFLLFAVTLESGTKAKGSLEFVAVAGPGGRKSVKVKAQMGSGPVYITNTILEGVGKKLRAEVGQPSEPPTGPAEPPPEAPKPPVNPIDPDGPNDPIVLPPTADPPKLFE